MSSLYEELLGRPTMYRPSHGWRRRVSFATDEELRHEQKLIEESATEAAKADITAGHATSKHLILASLRDGRARPDCEVRELTGLAYETVARWLSTLKKRGLVERIEIGPAVLWAVTQAEDEQ